MQIMNEHMRNLRNAIRTIEIRIFWIIIHYNVSI